MLDKKLLENLYFKEDKTQKEIAKILNVSQTYISQKFIELGIKSKRIWTKEDISYLEDKFGQYTVKTIARILNKSPEAVMIKAKRIGLESIINISEFLNSNQLARAIGVDRKTIVRWINKYELKATKKVLALKRPFWRIDIKHFWKWAEKHKDFIKWSKFEKNILGKEPEWVDEARKKDNLKPKREDEKWTTTEDEYLRMYWELNKKISEIGTILKRSQNSILKRAARIGLSKRKIILPWRPMEVETLIKMKIEGYTDSQIAEELGRGLEGVAWKRKMLIKNNKLNWSYRG